MALVPMQKINLFVHKKNKQKILSFLQKEGVLHLTDTSAKEPGLTHFGGDDESHDLQYKVAELDFAINFLSDYETKKKGVQSIIDGDSVKTTDAEIHDIVSGYDASKIIEQCKSVEGEMVTLSNEAKAICATLAKLAPWSHYKAPLGSARETETSLAVFAIIPLKVWEAFRNEVVSLSSLVVLELDNIVSDFVYCEVICDKSFANDVEKCVLSHKGEVTELPELEGTVTEETEKMNKRLEKIEERQGQLKKASAELAKNLKNLRILYDYYNWNLINRNAHRHFAATESTVVISGWMPKSGLKALENSLNKITFDFDLIPVSPDEGEEPPVLLENKGFMKPFQSVTNIYGLPLPNELDPTPYLAIFFIVFFGLALTDAIYGLLMFAIMFTVLRYLKIPKESQGLIRLLMYAGLVTFFAGALYGGWGSMDASQAPEWMTTTNADGEKAFLFQKINAITDPMTVLILSLVLGYIQVLVGVIMNFVHKYRTESKKDALIEHFPWVFTLSAIGLTLMAWREVILPGTLFTPMIYICIFGALMVAFVRPYKMKKPAIWMIPIIPLKLVFDGILRLYGIVGYLSDVLSYSRLLALGLATSIIGLAVNTIAGMVNGVPYIGILLAIVVLIVGHTFNIGINALGAFIHSGRLQFVEFFTKFLEGGGKAFNPLRKESKFVRFN